jgi:hypothetical protein
LARVTIVFGVLLILVGVVSYLIHPFSFTALIPALVGVLLASFGAVALNPGARKHSMHAAVVVGLLGFLAAAGRLIGAVASGKTPSPLAATSLGLMALLCGIFVVLCVRSFIAARRARQAAAA